MKEPLYYIKCNERVKNISPEELVEHLGSMEKFKEWIAIDITGQYLHDTWAAFFESDMMDHCKVIEKEMLKFR